MIAAMIEKQQNWWNIYYSHREKTFTGKSNKIFALPKKFLKITN